jgi:D-3-phosphoglycerate dehydrogenase
VTKTTIVAVAGARFEELDIEADVLATTGAVLRRTPATTRDELVSGCSGAAVVLAAAHPRFTRDVLASLPGLRAIVRYGIGVDNIDVAAASDHGIMVCNVPDFGTEEVALHAVALTLALMRRIHQASADTRAGLWDLGRLRPMHSPAACVAGVVGLGRIGRASARYLSGLGFRVWGFDPFLGDSALTDARLVVCATLDELFADADLVTLHLPATAETRGLIGRRTLLAMKPGVLIINTSRGELIDEVALLEGLDSGRVGGVGLDVLRTEPPAKDDPLLSHPRAIVTPHSAWCTVEAEQRLRRMAAAEVARVLRGERPSNLVNG